MLFATFGAPAANIALDNGFLWYFDPQGLKVRKIAKMHKIAKFPEIAQFSLKSQNLRNLAKSALFAKMGPQAARAPAGCGPARVWPAPHPGATMESTAGPMESPWGSVGSTGAPR